MQLNAYFHTIFHFHMQIAYLITITGSMDLKYKLFYWFCLHFYRAPIHTAIKP